MSCEHQQHHWNWCIIHVILFLIDISNSLTVTKMSIPNNVQRRVKDVELGCLYNLDGESLYSVKWYKDGNEFYRYVPRNKPPGQYFPLPGVYVDLKNSSDVKVVLRRISLLSSGEYRCEVSGEAPAFKTVYETVRMNVLSTPIGGPKLVGALLSYSAGDILKIACVAPASKPACKLKWYINGEPADKSFLRPRPISKRKSDGLEISTLGLEFLVLPDYFIYNSTANTNNMALLCQANIHSMYSHVVHHGLQRTRPFKAPALESRESQPDGDSAASCLFTTIHLVTLLSLAATFSSSDFRFSIR